MEKAERIRVRVPGKVNLALRVGGRRADGYHPLDTVFQAVSLFDEVEALPAPRGVRTVRVLGDQASLVPTDESNLALKAAQALASYAGMRQPGVELVIRKTIPVTGGMAGGSADAAAALIACAALWRIDVAPDELAVVAAGLGADVPFCLMGSTALGRGRGDELVPMLSRGSYHWVLALPDVELSTPEVFARFDELNPDAGPAPETPPGLLAGLASGDIAQVADNLVNDLQPAAVSLRPHLADVLAAGVDAGALTGIVSGSGPTCAFLSENEDAAVRLSNALAGSDLARAVRRVCAPVPGARLLSC
ncbi:4-(cytidine 5'-diphospho)-2-C-methyl-D-erythritol kinase [Propioniciclava flava]|uniref:4-diphosphocytidyl-2-C-methyl-D-erythritol kinase n=1 Tax=Propioniciclava flava TaxID=2072026 RepID=A0A4Q2EHI4_9ACTN|nr:4-(cytidine 5'-diphospho)-2-C-methyl-D-erythritol kinase [Propioniciclava flava]RXW33047.1 4-(cytidine 5'-diphospho)-2-C-methyl-D-erythritol kinase [Propioniciclava flava]